MNIIEQLLTDSYIRTITHYSLHLVFPIAIAYLFFNKPKGSWKKAYGLLLFTMLIDLDHLLATPIFDPNRCSVGFHFLHSYIAIGVYLVLMGFSKTRIVAVGLLFHVLTDYIDCLWIQK